MPRKMKSLSAFSLAAAVLMVALFQLFHVGFFLSLSITFGTIAYHLGVRLLIGGIFNITMKNQADCTRKWFQIRPWEKKLYQFLKVKQWKDKMPIYSPSSFSAKEHTWDEIAQAMCQSELVHETNLVFSFLPLIASIWFGSFSVFLLTSIGGAAFDLKFVMMQRYNRPRVLKLVGRKEKADGKSLQSTFYQLKYYVTESFYEHIVAEKYTVLQSADRCLTEFWRQLSERNMETLAVYSTLFSRVAFHAPEELRHFQKELNEMNRLFTSKIYHGLSADELEELLDDIDFINRKNV